MTDSMKTLDQLLAAIRVTSGNPDVEWADSPDPLSGGFWAQMWRVRLGGAPPELSGDLVARVMPDARVAARETVVQDHLARAGFATPSVRLAAGPGADLDRAWMMMDFVPGQPLLANLSGPSTLLRLPQIARSMPDRLATIAAALHVVDPGDLASVLADTNTDTDGDGDGDEVAAVLQRLGDQARTFGFTGLISLGEWLRKHRRAGDRRVVCHGDLHPFNVLTAPTGDTVVDWSSALIAPPAFDLAFTSLLLSHPPLAAPRVAQPAISLAGRALSRRFLATYSARSGAPIDAAELEWFTLLHALRILTEVATWEAQGELDQRAGHPFLALRAPLTARVAASTDIAALPLTVA